MIKRNEYLQKIRLFYESNLIKIIIGIRRCGKSVLLKQIHQELIDNGVDKNHIIYINLEDYQYSKLRNANELNDFISRLFKDEKKYYLLIDEIQWVEGWEKVINSLKSTRNTSIFLTGSNAKLLSSELSTLLTGRYVSFKINPFAFSEVISFKHIDLKNNNLVKETFNDYMYWGGMPQRFEWNDNIDATKVYLQDLLRNIFLVDIAQRFKISNIDLLEKMLEYFVTNPSQVFSPKNIINYFKSENLSVSLKTVYEYIDYLKTSLLMIACPIYDVRGKRILLRKDKYYLTDLGLGQILNTNKKPQIGSYLENIVYNELMFRGYDVSTIQTTNAEIDFIAKKDGLTQYYQICYKLDDGSGNGNKGVIQREFNPLMQLNDNYEKFILTLDEIDFSQNGIKHINLIDWLLNKKDR